MTTPAETAFSIPDGYVLVPKDVYEMLKSGMNPVSQQAAKDLEPIKITVKIAVHLGDAKISLGVGEEIHWYPNKYLKIRGGEKPTASFMTLWNSQNPGSVNYKAHSPKYFEVLNPEALEQHGISVAPRKTSQLDKGGNSRQSLPPRGSEERKQLIRDRGVDNATAIKHTGGAPLGVAELDVTVQQTNHAVMGSITEVLKIEEGQFDLSAQATEIDAKAADRTRAKRRSL